MRETGVPGEKPSGQGESKQQTHLKHNGERQALSHCATSATQNISYILIIYNSTYKRPSSKACFPSIVLDLQSSIFLVSWPSLLDPGSFVLGPWSAALSLPCFLALICAWSWDLWLGSMVLDPVLISSNWPTTQYLTRKYFVHNFCQPCITTILNSK